MRDSTKVRLARTAVLVLPLMPHWVTRRVAACLRLVMMERIARVREPDFQVVRNDRDVYLRRWWVIPRNDDFNIYLHNMLRDDDPILHDHMYVSHSLCLDGVLREVYQEYPPIGSIETRMVGEGDVTIRSPGMAHQLIVIVEAWTIFVTGPRVKQWGFWCPKGFRHWSKYVATNQDPSVRGNGVGSGTSGIGVGCGEQGD